MSVIARLRAAGFEAYTRHDWGSVRPGDYSQRARTRRYQLPGDLPYHYLHITVTPDTDTLPHGFAGARKVESYGLSTPPMVSYQMLTTNEGKAFEGQNYRVKGTHTINDKGVPGYAHDLNRLGYAVALMQNIGDAVSAEQVELIAATFAATELEGHVRRGAPIFPHRMFDWKECPGEKAMRELPKIQTLKDRFVKDGLPGGPPEEDDMAVTDTDIVRLLNFPLGTKDQHGQPITVGKALRTAAWLGIQYQEKGEFEEQLDRIEQKGNS